MKVTVLAGCLFCWTAGGASFGIASFDPSGRITWTNAFPNGICTLERTAHLPGTWVADRNVYTTGPVGVMGFKAPTQPSFYRLLAVDISATPQGFTNLTGAYGTIRTIAGNGLGGTDGVNYWRPTFEGGPATNAALSRPHFAMADDAGNIDIVDKDSHSLLRVSPDGLIHTVAGTHTPGFNGDGAAQGTSIQLNSPNGEWVRGDGTVYILDTGNSKVRRLGTDGVLTTLFTDPAGLTSGRGLWVKSDESLAYYADGTKLKRWTPAGGVLTLNSNFNDLGNLAVRADGNVVATDRGNNKVYLVDATGSNVGGRSRIAGDGSTNAVVDGTLVLTNGLYGVRGVWLLPNGGYLLATHEGSQVLYVDAAGYVHRFVDGTPGNVHAGDGQWFYSPGPKVSEVRAVSMDSSGNILITENDYGYVRMISFQRKAP